jgi:hypothetical protein
MRLKLTTTYDNVDQAWLDWWLKNNGPIYGIQSDNVERDEWFTHSVASKDPTSDVFARTVIELLPPVREGEGE